MSKLIRRIKFIIMSIGLIVLVGAIAIFVNLFSSDNNISSNKNKSSDITNILLLGDTTDAMMIASVDEQNKNIKLTPVEDATYVDTSNKETLLKSLEKNTNLDLDKFLQINTSDLMNAVSILGDIQINVSKDDLALINNLIPKFYAECEDDDKGKMKLLSKSGLQNINEYQAMAYVSVISKDINKQKEILISFIKGIKNVDITKYAELFNTLKPYIDTNLTLPDMLKLASINYQFN